MLYVSLLINLALLAAIGSLWLKARDQKGDAERAAREFELMLQTLQAEQRTELLQAHGLLMHSRQELREALANRVDAREQPEGFEVGERRLSAAVGH